MVFGGCAYFGGSVLFLLTGTTADALGGHTLDPKGGPRTKILASFAPFDFQDLLVGGGTGFNHPDCHVTDSANTLVLAGDNVERIRVAAAAVVPPAADTAGRTDPHLAAHDTGLFATVEIGVVVAGAAGTASSKFGKVDETRKFGELDILGRFNVLTAVSKKEEKKKVCELN